MDQGPESKRPRLSTGTSWSAGTAHHGVSLPNPAPPPQAPHHPTPPGPYQPSHPFPRSSEPPPPPLSSSTQHYDDRRHHEPDHFPPMQEHRQPPRSPAHHPPPYTPYPRDPVVKRDPVDDALPQLRRPHSTGNAIEALPSTPHGLPPQSHLEDRRHMSYDSGPQPPPPPPPAPSAGPMYRTPSYPPPTPLQAPQHYEHSIYGPPPQAPDPIYSIAYSTTGKRKAQRASQACDSCRSLKAKCDETKPCKNCREKGVECKYRDPVPKQQDKVAADILEGINLLRNELKSGLGAFEVRMSKVEKALKLINPSVDVDMDDAPGADPQDAASPAPLGDDVCSSPEPITAEAAPPGDAALTLDEAHRIARQMQTEDDLDEVPPGPMVPPGEPAMPVAHTTLAGLLLTWRPIQDKVKPILDAEGIKWVEEYPIRQEERRGLLRLFGRGEGPDREFPSSATKDMAGDLGTIGGSQHQQVVDNADDMSDIASPSPGDAWGQTGGLSPPPSVDLKGGPLRPNGDLDLDPDRVWTYVKSYEDNMQNMHPLIIPKELHAIVKVFLDRVPTGKPPKPTSLPVAYFTQSLENTSVPPLGTKRKRSPGGDGELAAVQAQKPGKPFRNIDTALVLLVFALGKICLWKDRKLPDPVPESDAVPNPSPLLRNGHPPSPNQGSPPSYSSHSQSSAAMSPKFEERAVGSRRQSLQGSAVWPVPQPRTGVTLKRNLDTIPGLEYFAIATDIIGNHIGGKTLKHVWVYILASLYFGQLGRPLQSMEHIVLAGRTLQCLLRPHLDRYWRMKLALKPLEDKRDNQYAFAFWTCLQLESDILAELQIPPSGILAYERQMPYPNNHLALSQGFSDYVLESYMGQLYLRNALNEIHKTLYDARRPSSPIPESSKRGDKFNTIDILVDSLDPSRWVPKLFKFEESDQPAADILAARLRAKYWGARVITYRPFIKMILNFNHKRSSRHPSGPTSGDYRDDINIPQIHPEARSSGDIPPQVIEYAERGITALVESTRAFHGVEDKRPIITNVFGTAHAQWGNLLILYAVHRDPLLGSSLDERTLMDLFRKTIDFFEIVAQGSSSLVHDMRILKGLQRELELELRKLDLEMGPGSSFSSGTPAPLLTASGPIPSSLPMPSTPSEAAYTPTPTQYAPTPAAYGAPTPTPYSMTPAATYAPSPVPYVPTPGPQVPYPGEPRRSPE